MILKYARMEDAQRNLDELQNHAAGWSSEALQKRARQITIEGGLD